MIKREDNCHSLRDDDEILQNKNKNKGKITLK